MSLTYGLAWGSPSGFEYEWNIHTWECLAYSRLVLGVKVSLKKFEVNIWESINIWEYISALLVKCFNDGLYWSLFSVDAAETHISY